MGGDICDSGKCKGEDGSAQRGYNLQKLDLYGMVFRNRLGGFSHMNRRAGLGRAPNPQKPSNRIPPPPLPNYRQ